MVGSSGGSGGSGIIFIKAIYCFDELNCLKNNF